MVGENVVGVSPLRLSRKAPSSSVEMTGGWRENSQLEVTVSLSHGERKQNDPELAKGNEGKSNHPGDLSCAIPHQGVLPSAPS